MINQKLYRSIAVLVLTATLFSACKKVDQDSPESIGNQSAVSLTDGGMPGSREIAVDFISTPSTVVAVEVKRTFSSEADLNGTLNVVLKDDTAAVKAAGLTVLPSGLYTTSVAKTGAAGGTYNVTFQARETAKAISITLADATALDPDVSYGLGFTIESVDAKGVISLEKTVVVKLVIKNIYDGRYLLKGFHNRPTLSDSYEEEVHLITTGANSVKMFWPALGEDAHPIHGGVTFYANFTTEFLFNKSTNALSGVVNTYNPEATPFTLVNESNRYDASSKTIFAKYFYNGNQDRMFTDTLIYIGAR